MSATGNRIMKILKTVFELMFTEVIKTKTQSCLWFDFFKIMTVKNTSF